MSSGFIDSHVHVWTSDCHAFPKVTNAARAEPLDFTPECILDIARPAGVRRLVLVQVSFYGEDNRYMLDAIRRYPHIFSGIPFVDPTAADAVERLKNLTAAGTRGFRILPQTPADTWSDLPGMRRLWSFAETNGLPVCALVNPESLPGVGHMCQQFPATRLVIEHMGRIGMDGHIRNRDVHALCALAAHANIYVKVSAFYALAGRQQPYLDLAALIRRVFDAFGPERMLWGSDAPGQLRNGHTYTASLELVSQRLGFLTSADREAILRKTAEHLFFSPPSHSKSRE